MILRSLNQKGEQASAHNFGRTLLPSNLLVPVNTRARVVKDDAALMMVLKFECYWLLRLAEIVELITSALGCCEQSMIAIPAARPFWAIL